MRRILLVLLLLLGPLMGAPAARAQSSCVQVHALKAPSAQILRSLQAAILDIDPDSQALFDEGAFQNVAFRMANQGERQLSQELENWIQAELQSGEIREIRPLEGPKTLSTVFKVEFQSGLKGIFKLDGRYNRRGGGTYRLFSDPLAEVAAYKLDRLIGLGAVAVTTLREIDLAQLRYPRIKGSLQAWVSSTNEAGPELSKMWTDWRRKIRIFDYLIHNQDRNKTNFLPSHELLGSIDHGGAFKEESLILGAYPPLALKRLPADRRYAAFYQTISQVTDAQITGAVQGLITETALSELLERRQKLLRQFQTNMSYRFAIPDYELDVRTPTQLKALRQAQANQTPPRPPAPAQQSSPAPESKEAPGSNSILNPFLWNPWLQFFRSDKK